MIASANSETAGFDSPPAAGADAARTESSNAPPGSTLRVSLLRNAPGIVLFAICLADIYQFADPDIWGHIRFGQLVLSTHHAILHDTFSYTAFGREFRNHEWLTDATMAFIYNHAGILGLKIWKFLLVAGTILAVVAALAETGASIASQMIVLIVAAAMLQVEEQYRPQTYTFFFFATTIALLARHNYRGSAPMYLTLPMMLLWSNVHGGFVVGLGAMGIYTAAAGLEDLLCGRGIKRAWALAFYTLAATLITLVNPFGIENWRTVLQGVFSPYIRSVISDWRPLIPALIDQLHSNAPTVALLYLLAIGMIAVLAVTFCFTPQGGDLPLAAAAAAMSYAAFNAQRNIPLAAIAAAPVLARHSSLCFERLRARNKVGPPLYSTNPDGLQRIQRITGAFAILLAIAAGVFSPRLQDDRGYPAGAIAFMKTHRLHGDILNDFDWGEYLIWHEPESKVFIDGRFATVYPFSVIQEYLDFYIDNWNSTEALKSYPADFVLISRTRKACDLMKRQPDWKLIYMDRDSELFAKRNSTAAQLPDEPVVGHVPPKSYFP